MPGSMAAAAAMFCWCSRKADSASTCWGVLGVLHGRVGAWVSKVAQGWVGLVEAKYRGLPLVSAAPMSLPSLTVDSTSTLYPWQWSTFRAFGVVRVRHVHSRLHVGCGKRGGGSLRRFQGRGSKTIPPHLDRW